MGESHPCQDDHHGHAVLPPNVARAAIETSPQARNHLPYIFIIIENSAYKTIVIYFGRNPFGR
jgi:hypothetical protein